MFAHFGPDGADHCQGTFADRGECVAEPETVGSEATGPNRAGSASAGQCRPGSPRPKVIVEPDSLAQLDSLPTGSARSERTSLIAYATEVLATRRLVHSYLDGGNATWIKPAVMADRLAAAGVEKMRGFAVGVASFDATDISSTYGQQVATALSGLGVRGARFVIDTSRNGNGAMDENGQHVDSCNPAGRRLGVPSSIGVGGAEYR
ncbi:glycoside hydrolase family 6 protein [Streptomyces sp. NPDC052101]|uniref:glycoside hydrolase family 6 protein n=1 Tax=Streptomyces sp. NPDC052101 TaxID=3155763 RepID=UPI003435F9DD